ncbi:MXAN_6640 family putative metalloprotease [Nocardioides montaniterrae]
MSRTRTLTLALLIALGLTLTTPSAYAGTTPPSPGANGLSRALLHAQAALQSVQQILAGNGSNGHPDLTMALRNLAVTKNSLPPAQRAVAERYFARPSQPSTCSKADGVCWKSGAKQHKLCTSRICIHYVKKSQDARNGVPREDDGRGGTWSGRAHNGIPDVVEFDLKQLSRIDRVYQRAGYRSPRGDGGRGGDSRRDIYLADVGDNGVYGFCTTDDPKLNDDNDGSKHYAVYAYCVLDNNYSKTKFPAHTPEQNLEVTAAHEYFHAVQFAYDIDEDQWFMEATATWAEDQLYTTINDNRQYLRLGPMGRPGQALDLFNSDGHQYGTWIFFRFLTERYGAKQGIMPKLVKRMWQLAVGRRYSIVAIRTALNEVGTTFGNQLRNFAVANLHPGQHYREGGAYKPAPLTGTTSLPQLLGNKATWKPSLAHQSSATYQVTPAASASQLSVTFHANPGHWVLDTIVVHTTDGHTKRVNPALGATTTLPFTKASVAWVQLTIVNAGVGYNCWQYLGFDHTCMGTSTDDNPGASVQVIAS